MRNHHDSNPKLAVILAAKKIENNAPWGMHISWQLTGAQQLGTVQAAS